MVRFSFDNIRFEEKDGVIMARFLDIFEFDIPYDILPGKATVIDGELEIEGSESKVNHKFNRALDRGFTRLKNRLTGKPAVYIHRNSGIPLHGSNAIGLVDRGSTVIEVKPVTSCNLKCIYCSVNEDRRLVDYVVEADYLVEEFGKLVKYKGIPGIEAHIGTQGEPLLYGDMVHLVEGLAAVDGVETISIDTNGVLLTKELIDELVKAGLTRFNVSLNAWDEKTATTIAGVPHNISQLKGHIEYIATKCDLIVAPVLVPGYNESEIEEIVRWISGITSDHDIRMGIQNYLEYRGGRNPTRQWPMDKFMLFLQDLERKYPLKLIFGPEDFNIHEARSLPAPFKRGDHVRARIIAPGRLRGEQLAVAQDRIITVTGAPDSGTIKLKITRSKHNIFYGIPV